MYACSDDALFNYYMCACSDDALLMYMICTHFSARCGLRTLISVVHASQSALISEAQTCRERPSEISHQKRFFVYLFYLFFIYFMHVLCAIIFAFLPVSCMCCVLSSIFFHHGFFPAIDGDFAQVLARSA